VGQELGVARGRQEGRTIPAIGAYGQVTVGCDKPSLNFAHATIKFRARDNADRMDPRGGEEASVDVAAWLHGLGLQQYEQAFRENAIDDAVLLELTADDLKDLGVSLVGHRRKLLAAIAALRSESGPEPRAEARGVADTSIAERRHLTVMFCDLVGSTALSTRYDPEELRAIISTYHRCCTELVERNGGCQEPSWIENIGFRAE
jgi:SAM domain (Sterile alpha motif)/Adenylate and Guanylate cyclase catalytic domain